MRRLHVVSRTRDHADGVNRLTGEHRGRAYTQRRRLGSLPNTGPPRRLPPISPTAELLRRQRCQSNLVRIVAARISRRSPFSRPPTREEAAALIAFGAERREAVRKSHVSATNRANAKRLGQKRRDKKAAQDADLLKDVESLRAKHPQWRSRQIARRLLLDHEKYKPLKVSVATLARRIDRALKASLPKK